MAARDVALIGVLIFTFAIGFFIVHFAFNTITTDMIANDQINSSSAAVGQLESVEKLTNRLDYVVFGLFVALVLSLIITGWFIGGSPIFMFVYFIVVIVAVLVSFILSNVWETITTNAQFGTTLLSFSMSNNLMLNLPIYMTIVGFIGLIVMFAKPYFGGGE